MNAYIVAVTDGKRTTFLAQMLRLRGKQQPYCFFKRNPDHAVKLPRDWAERIARVLIAEDEEGKYLIEAIRA